MIEVRVPGKVMLSGEYAVLHGGTAVLVPVPRYLTVSGSAKGESGLHSPVVQAALEYRISEVAEHEQESGLPDVYVDYSEFLRQDSVGNLQKLGIGSSAAEAVGVIALRFELAGLRWTDSREKIARYAQEVHSRIQGGIGSGADIAACAFGEPIKFRRDDGSCSVKPIRERDADLPLHLAWAGHPADTRQMVTGFHAWLSRQGRSAEATLSRLVESSDRLADLWFTRPLDQLFAQLDRFCETLQDCMRAAELEHMLPIHHTLQEWALEHGGRAKPTGAGGGDMIVLVGDLPVDELGVMIIPLKLELSR